jgi:ABC-type sulfate/molybdate transport systems ATPase subunit
MSFQAVRPAVALVLPGSQPALLLLTSPSAAWTRPAWGSAGAGLQHTKSLRASVIFVTHDQEEAFHRPPGGLDRGRLEQIDTPEQIFHSSATHS